MTDEPPQRPSPILLRLAAAIIDYTIVIVVVLPLQLAWTTTTGRGSSETTVPTTAANWIALGLIAAYPIVSLAAFGTTAGKRLFSLEVSGRRGGRPGWLSSTVRFVVSIAPFLAGPLLKHVPAGAARTAAEFAQVILMAAIYAPILFDDRRRGIHDRVATTFVTCRVPALFREPTVSNPPT